MVFTEAIDRFSINVVLTAELVPFNPFDFFVDPAAETYPFSYDALTREALLPFLVEAPQSAEMVELLAKLPAQAGAVTFITEVNERVANAVHYTRRDEPGVQTPEHTLASGAGSCRDSAWLLVQMLRQLGLAARFVSGYQIQLGAVPDSGSDSTDLHAWAEVYLPGAGWIGLDPTSGLLAAEGHIPVAATARPQSAAPVSGLVAPSEVAFSHDMQLERVTAHNP